jgi:alpha-amylase
MMTRKLALVIHFHQPVGNLDAVVRKATDNCYRPFLETLDRYPDLKMTLHYSGCLLEWLEAEASDVTSMIRTLSERGQIELLTGGFYEPILAALPRRDQVGQIRMLSQHLASSYGADATGLWLTERVWEQEVVGAITEANVRYTVLDDTMFHSVGIGDEELTGPFVTDHDGKPLLVYAGDRSLRYLIPYKRVDRVLEYLTSGSDDRLFVYADDGEKFGEWPDTHARVYDDGWLDAFFQALLEGETEVITLGEHAAVAEPKGRVYLPSSSYDEMMTWALPADARLKVGTARRELQKDDPEGILPFVRGAPWRAFLAKYPEVNQLQKRMLNVSDAVHAAGAPRAAVTELYRAQCNCAYWHGAFGGVYLAFMRAALWHHLARAEGLVKQGREHVAQIADLDADSHDEVLLTGAWGAAVISPREGILVELDDWSVGANLLAVAARHQEAYHLAEENPPEESDDHTEMVASQAHSDVDAASLTFDTRRLGGLIDLIDGEPLGREDRFEWSTDGTSVTCSVDAGDLGIEKVFESVPNGLACTVRLVNNGSAAARIPYALETAALPLNLGRDSAKDLVGHTDEGWSLKQPEGEVGLEVRIDPVGETTAEPIVTASTSLEGLQTMFQGTIVTTRWDLALEPGETVEIREVLVPRPQPENLDKKERGVSA